MSEPLDEQHRVLVVDDEEYLTDLLSTSLRFQGFEVAIAKNGFDALSTADSFGPDLIVLDVMMPDIDGLEVCGRLRSGGNQVPVPEFSILEVVTSHEQRCGPLFSAQS